jgi:hypothetical protein
MFEKLKIISSSIWTFVLPFLRLMLSKAGPILAQAALAAVQAVAANASGASSSQKRNQAFELISADLRNQGIKVGVDVSTALVNAAIETAVLKLKEK